MLHTVKTQFIVNLLANNASGTNLIQVNNRLYVLDWRAGFRLSLYKNEGSNPSRAAIVNLK